ncbi:erythromycin esterase family protein [Streptomyces sp. NPDC048644]|uniref:erythromycin esterase family protein n=1 Tax=Streptomyces sp. NPDC048644 TaxID=3365582 RepID=UPI00371D8AC7
MNTDTTAPRRTTPSRTYPSGPRHADAGPLSGAALDELAGRLADGATIVGIGESTRAARETFGVRDQLFRRLVGRHGFRALAVQDSADVAARLDGYVRGGGGSAASALDGAWRPWRTAEMAEALTWMREFNQDHPDDPIRIFGVKPAQAQPDDYDAVLDHVRASAPERLAQAASYLGLIRTAHHTDEHVQRARGTHPGRPFADHARDALALVRSLPGAGTASRTPRQPKRSWAWPPSAARSPESAACCVSGTAPGTSRWRSASTTEISVSPSSRNRPRT